jgi:hypothetical protein
MALRAGVAGRSGAVFTDAVALPPIFAKCCQSCFRLKSVARSPPQKNALIRMLTVSQDGIAR